MRRIVPIVLAAALLPGLATAATPDSGSLSEASPTVSWSGTLTRPYATHLAFAEEGAAGATGQYPCEAPGCDSFALTLAEGPTTLSFVLASEQTGDLSMRVQDPAGAWTYYDGWSDATAGPQKFSIKKAAAGTYTVQITARVFGTGNPTAVDDTADYTATVSRPASAPPPASTPGASGGEPAPAATTGKKRSKRAACTRKAKKIKKASKRRKALKRCRKKRR